LRRREVIALGFVAPGLPQESELFCSLHAFRDHLELEAMPHRNDRLRDRGVVRVAGAVAHELAIDLETVDGEALQIAQARIPGPEIVHRQAHAETLQVAQYADGVLGLRISMLS
jgi:hypothetical protein